MSGYLGGGGSGYVGGAGGGGGGGTTAGAQPDGLAAVDATIVNVDGDGVAAYVELGDTTIPAGTLEPGDKIIVEAFYSFLNNSGGTVNVQNRVKVGALDWETNNTTVTAAANRRDNVCYAAWLVTADFHLVGGAFALCSTAATQELKLTAGASHPAVIGAGDLGVIDPDVDLAVGWAVKDGGAASTVNILGYGQSVHVVKAIGSTDATIIGAQGPQGIQGIQGIQGEQGEQGDTGPAGPGLAAGGSTGQVAAKASGDDYDVEWVDAPAAGTGVTLTGSSFSVTTLPGVAKVASFTYALVDAGKSADCTSASEIVATIPTNAAVAYPLDTILGGVRLGAGAVSVVGDGGVTVVNPYDSADLRAVGSQWSARKVATDTWLLAGDFTPNP